MARTRSPEYPAISLKEAIEKVGLIYRKDYQNKLSKQIIAEHIGYKGLNGGSLPVIAALGKYGLLEGRGDETRVSDLGVAIVAHPPGSPERIQALRTAAGNPELFSELDAKFQGGKASDPAIRGYLLTQRFIPSAADTAVRSYRETKALVEGESAGYNGSLTEEPSMPVADNLDRASSNIASGLLAERPERARLVADAPKPGERREVITLDEGDVVITFPEDLTPESVSDLEDHLNLFIKKVKRRTSGRTEVDAAN